MAPNVKGASYNNKFDSNYGYASGKSGKGKKRDKAYSIHENYSYAKPKTIEQKVPLNKNYDLYDNKNQSKRV